MTEQLITAFVLGLAGGIIPGPVLTITFTEILQSGFIRGLRIVIIALLAETLVALSSLLLLSALGLSESIFQSISLVGALVLLWLAWSVWKIRGIDTTQRLHFSFGKVFILIFSNGMLWSYWMAVCVPRAMLLSKEVWMGEYLFILTVEAGWLIATVAAAAAFASFRRILSHPTFMPILFKFFAASFVYFALTMAYQSVTYFLGR